MKKSFNILHALCTLPCHLFREIIFVFMILYPLFNELIFSSAFGLQVNIYKILFSLSIGFLISLVGHIFKSKLASFTLQAILCVIVSFIYITQQIYYSIFSTPYIISSLDGLAKAFAFKDVAINSFKNQWVYHVLYLLLIVVLFTFYRISFFRQEYSSYTKLFLLPLTVLCFVCSIAIPLNTTSGIGSAKYLLLNEFIPLSSAKTFGVPTSMSLDLRYKFFETIPYTTNTNYANVSLPNASNTSDTSSDTSSDSTSSQNDEVDESKTPTTTTKSSIENEKSPVVYNPQTLDIDFDLNEKNKTYLEMNNFFSSKAPTMENEYTGMFEGKNLILITAEAFSDKLIDPVLTPTLYKMFNEGFQFNNFYTPIWGVSTSDGEFVATTGLIPKAGVWSYTEIADNYMPFAFGNQFNKLGFTSYAFHNHDYTYYNRQLSYPNMGYDYYAKGKGLDITPTWPESDIELVEQATPFFIDDENFHVYMLTVSGHLEYTYYGNAIACENRDKVEHLDYCEPVQAYISCNLELEYALADLIDQLDKAGQLEDTVIALSADHYPYGLKPNEYAELYNKDSIDETFELYENGFLLWNSEMSEPIKVDKYCSSLDIAPTLSNLFNLDFDSRLYMGQDIFSDNKGLVMFLDRSYITDDYMYNANTGDVTYLTEDKVSSIQPEQIELNSQKVAGLFRYSGMIIEHDYYRYLLE